MCCIALVLVPTHSKIAGLERDEVELCIFVLLDLVCSTSAYCKVRTGKKRLPVERVTLGGVGEVIVEWGRGSRTFKVGIKRTRIRCHRIGEL